MKISETKLENVEKIAEVLKKFQYESVQLLITEYLLNVSDGKNEKINESRKKNTTRKRRENTEKKQIKQSTTKSGRPGPSEMIEKLLNENYFDSEKTIGEVIEYCKHQYAYVYKSSDFSPTLARAVRNNKLIREQNTEKQYAYKKR